MRKIVVTEYVSLDGFAHTPSWTAPYWGDDIAEFKDIEQQTTDALLLGRVTYQEFSAVWPTMPEEEGADFMNNLPKFVVSNTLNADDMTWNATLIESDIVTAINKLKSQGDGDLLVYGSINFVETLMDNELVDQYNLLVYPVLLGSGKRLFADFGKQINLKLTKTRAFASGVVMMIYAPDNQQ